MFQYEATEAAPYAYLLYAVTRFRTVRETVVYGPSAQAVVDQAIAHGYVRAEAAPASPVNGCQGLPFRAGDTAAHDTRKAVQG